MLGQVHAVLAGAMNAPELMLADAEATALATAMADVQAQYNAKIDPRARAWAQLCIVMGAVYIPKVVQINQRRRAEREQQNEDAGGAPYVPGLQATS